MTSNASAAVGDPEVASSKFPPPPFPASAPARTRRTAGQLSANRLSFTFGDGLPDKRTGSPAKWVFRDIDLQTYPHELVALIGPTGTGKSTLLRCLGGFLRPTSGHVYLRGHELVHPSSRVALIHQSIATFPWMTALENVQLALKCKDLSDEDATELSLRMLELVGLREFANDYPKELSGGMRQKIAIARALAAEPTILLMDEPFVHLDELTAEALRQEIYSLVFNPETTLESAILVSHNLSEVVELADRILVMKGQPAAIVEEVPVDLPHPRSPRDPSVYRILDHLHDELDLNRVPHAR